MTSHPHTRRETYAKTVKRYARVVVPFNEFMCYISHIIMRANISQIGMCPMESRVYTRRQFIYNLQPSLHACLSMAQLTFQFRRLYIYIYDDAKKRTTTPPFIITHHNDLVSTLNGGGGRDGATHRTRTKRPSCC